MLKDKTNDMSVEASRDSASEATQLFEGFLRCLRR